MKTRHPSAFPVPWRAFSLVCTDVCLAQVADRLKGSNMHAALALTVPVSVWVVCCRFAAVHSRVFDRLQFSGTKGPGTESSRFLRACSQNGCVSGPVFWALVRGGSCAVRLRHRHPLQCHLVPRPRPGRCLCSRGQEARCPGRLVQRPWRSPSRRRPGCAREPGAGGLDQTTFGPQCPRGSACSVSHKLVRREDHRQALVPASL